MADFASWAFRFCEALDGRGDGFVDAYAQSIGQRAITALEVHPLGVAVQAFMDGRDTWQGTPAELLNELEAVADQEKICTSDSAWPGSASWLGRRLREVMVDLKELGIVFEENRDGRRRTITLEKL